MANYAILKAAIQQVVRENHNNEITGDLLQQALLSIVTTLGACYQFAGVATPTTSPGTPDYNCFYVAAVPGSYPNFSGLTVDENEIAFLKWNGAWVKESISVSTGGGGAIEYIVQMIEELEQKVDALALGKFYGFFPTPQDLPEGDAPGYAYVGNAGVFSVYAFIDGEWTDSGTVTEPLTGNEEDIDLDDQYKLQFANRPNTNGMGFVILRRFDNLTTKITSPNTVYEIRYNFALGGATLNVPDNCVLKFTGGKITNGTINGNNTKIDAGLVKIFESTTLFSGSFVVDKVYPEWFGAVGLYYQSSNEATTPTALLLPADADNLTDAAPAINSSFALASCGTGVVYCQRQIYRIGSKVTIPMKCTLETQEDTIFDVRLAGSGTNKIIHDYNTSAFSAETPWNTLSLYPNEFFAPTSMAVAFEVGSVKTKLIGRGVITLVNSHHTIGILIPGTGYQYLDMSYESPYIDIRTVGGKRECIAPDNRDLYGDSDPDNSDGENGQYYWNTTNETYWLKSNGTWSQVYINEAKGSLFNVSLRIDVGQGWNTGRIIRPYIHILDMFGWRGVEIYTHDLGWCNDCIFEGSISNKHGSFVSLFTDYDIQYCDFKNVTCQVDRTLQYDCRVVHAIRATCFTAPRTWDLEWAKPPRANLSPNGRILYFGNFVKNSTMFLDLMAKYFSDYGQNNATNYLQQFVNFDKHSSVVLSGLGYKNLLDSRTPYNARATRTNDSTRIIATRYDNPEDVFANEIPLMDVNSQPPHSLFDGDDGTFFTAIDTGDGKYGYIFHIADNNSRADSAPNNDSYIELSYRLKLSSDNDRVYCWLYCSNNSTASRYGIQLPGATSNNDVETVRSVLLPITFYGGAEYDLVLFTTSAASGIKLTVSSVKYWIKSVRPEYSGYTPDITSHSGPTNSKPNAAKKGHQFYDTTTDQLLVNIGNADTQNWSPVPIGSGSQPTAVIYNANPGESMTWKGADGATKSSIEQFVETADVYPLSASLFINNETILKITKYPIQATPPASLYRAFGSMTSVEEIPYVNCVGVTNMSGFVRYCKLKTFPALKMASVENVEGIFEGCESLESIPLLDWSSVTNCRNAFFRCYALKDVGGFTGLAVSVSFIHSNVLTRESVLNIFNNLATVSGQTIELHNTVKALLSSDDIAIATNKGWTVQ